jgi:hypothetical protein
MREFTQQEQDAIISAESALHLRGIHVYGDLPQVNENGQIIAAQLEKYPAPVTYDTVLAAANQLVDKLHYQSKEAKEFNVLLATMTADEVSELQSFFDRRPLTGLGVKEGFLNAILLVEWCRRMGVAVDFSGLSAAMEAWRPGLSNFAAPRQLHWIEPTEKPFLEREYVNGRKNWAAVKEEPPKVDPNAPKYRNGRLDHSTDPRYKQKPATPSLDATEESWKNMAQSKLRSGRNHSQNQELQEAYDAALATGRSWRYVFDQVAAVKRQHQVRSY